MIRLWIAIMIMSVNILLSTRTRPPKTNGSAVRFPSLRPLYVALGRPLVLEAIIEPGPDEKILYVTWERSSPAGSVRLADHTTGITYNGVIMSRDGSEIRIPRVQDSDYGTYIISVTLASGVQIHAQRDVLKADKPPDTSITLLCIQSGERAHWDSPVVTWLIDGVELTNQTANMSDGGSRLHLQEVKGRNYTCISDSSLGTSVAHFIIPEWPKERCRSRNAAPAVSTETVIVLLVSVLTVWIVEELLQ